MLPSSHNYRLPKIDQRTPDSVIYKNASLKMSQQVNKALSKAAKANGEGATFLELQETGKALRYFRNALNHLNDGCQASVGELPSASAMDGSATSLLSGTAVSSRPIRLGVDAQAAARPVSPENPTAFYSQAFVLEDFHKGVVTIERHSFCSAVLIYNTALALHQKGSKEDTVGHKVFLKALLFYGEAMSLLRPVSDDPESFRVMQEIMKNQADIYYKLNDLGNVQRVWEELAIMTKERNLSGPCQNTPSAVSA